MELNCAKSNQMLSNQIVGRPFNFIHILQTNASFLIELCVHSGSSENFQTVSL